MQREDPVIKIGSAEAIAMLRAGQELCGARISEAVTFLDAVGEGVHCKDCHFESFSASCAQFHRSAIFERCTFQHCDFYAAYFLQGLLITQCELKTRVVFQSGGHNNPKTPFVIKDSVFHDFVDFEDCWFTGPVTIENVEFRAGTNLLGNFETPMQVTFDFAPVIENTRGELDTNTFSRSPS